MSSINNILEQCQKLWESLLNQKTTLEALEGKLNAQRDGQEKERERLDKWNSELAEREIATGKIENIVDLNSENKKLANVISQEKEKLAQEIRTYTEYMTKENALLNQKRVLLSQDEETLKKGQEKLEVDTGQMEKDRSEFKKKVIEKIAAKI